MHSKWAVIFSWINEILEQHVFSVWMLSICYYMGNEWIDLTLKANLTKTSWTQSTGKAMLALPLTHSEKNFEI